MNEKLLEGISVFVRQNWNYVIGVSVRARFYFLSQCSAHAFRSSLVDCQPYLVNRGQSRIALYHHLHFSANAAPMHFDLHSLIVNHTWSIGDSLELRFTTTYVSSINDQSPTTSKILDMLKL